MALPDADVLVGAAKAPHGVALEVGHGQEGVIVQQILPHGHLREPLAALHREHHGAVLVQDVHRAEGPAVDLQGLSVLFCCVAVAVVIGVGLQNGGLGQFRLD